MSRRVTSAALNCRPRWTCQRCHNCCSHRIDHSGHGKRGKLWRGEPNGWFPVGGSPVLKRIAVDPQGDAVWVIDIANLVRKCAAGSWSQPPGNGSGKDICVVNGKAWIVGMDDTAYVSTTTGWTKRFERRSGAQAHRRRSGEPGAVVAGDRRANPVTRWTYRALGRTPPAAAAARKSPSSPARPT